MLVLRVFKATAGGEVEEVSGRVMEPMPLKDWWALALTDTNAAAKAWRHLSPANRKAVRKATARSAVLDGEIRAVGAKIGAAVEEADLEDLIESWGSGGPLSEHIELELAAAMHVGRRWKKGEPVPGCSCERCTGLPADHPARVPAWKRTLEECRESERQRRGDDPDRDREWQRTVEKAKAVPITQIAHALGLGTPEGQGGKEVRVCCPFHDDEHPSMRLNVEKGFWYCDPCGEGGDGLGLYMRVKEVGWAEAVQALTESY